MSGIVLGIYKNWQIFPKHTYEISPTIILILKKRNCDTGKFSSLLKVNQLVIIQLEFEHEHCDLKSILFVELIYFVFQTALGLPKNECKVQRVPIYLP